jgi:Transglutaminase-like superfamily
MSLPTHLKAIKHLPATDPVASSSRSLRAKREEVRGCSEAAKNLCGHSVRRQLVIQLGEVTELSSQESLKQLWFRRGLTVAKILLRNPRILKKLLVIGPDEPRYVRPPRAYVLPEYRGEMRRCSSNEKYLRPTRWCNPQEPLVVALANELGAFEVPDWEFAEAAYWWTKTRVRTELVPLDSVSATVRRGTGTCMHLSSLWIALCRAAGIKARYKSFRIPLHSMPTDLNMFTIAYFDETELAVLPGLLNLEGDHAESEAFIDGKWVVADVEMSPEMQAHAGVPITRFGEDAIGSRFAVVPGLKLERFESLPRRAGIALRAQSLFPVVRERANVVFADMIPSGRKIIEEAGGTEAYDQRARRKRELLATDEIARRIRAAERPQFVEFER